MKEFVPSEMIEGKILLLRGRRVMLDRDLAALYEVPTFRFNEAVKRHRRQFPEDFMFRLTRRETENLTSQFAMSSSHGGRRTLPYAFTEHGCVMAANILRSERAVQMSVFVVRAFVRMRQLIGSQQELSAKLADLEKQLTVRLDTHETAIVDVLRQLMLLLNPPSDPEEPPKRISFTAKESLAVYKCRPGTAGQAPL